MTRWSRDATEFTVSVTFYPHANSSYGNIPKPILRMLGDPKTIKYTVQKDQILVSSGD